MSETVFDLMEMYRRAIAGDRATSWASRRAKATEDATVDDLANIAEEASSLKDDTRHVLADRLVSIGHPPGLHVLRPMPELERDWYLSEGTRGEPFVEYGTGEDDEGWDGVALTTRVPESERVTHAGGYTVARTARGGYVLLTTAKRREPIEWKSR